MRTLNFAVLVVVANLIPAEGLLAQSPPSEATAAPISLAQLQERGIAGRLGPRLGTIVEVSGTVIENKSLAKGDAGEPYFLRVNFVNERELEEPQLFSASSLRISRDAPAFKVEDKFTCVGYERGQFVGSPPGEFKYVPPYATRSFGFAVEFVILKVN